MQITMIDLKEKGIVGIIDFHVLKDLMNKSVSDSSQDEKNIRIITERTVVQAKAVNITRIKMEGVNNLSKDPGKVTAVKKEFEKYMKRHTKNFVEGLSYLNKIADKQLILGFIDKSDEKLALELASAFAELEMEKFIEKEA